MALRAGDAKYGDGVPISDTRIGNQGELIVSNLHARHYEQSLRRNLFFSTSLARATSLPATAMVGNIVWNPPNSGVNCAVTKWSSQIVASSATCTGIVLGIGYQTTVPTGVTVANTTGAGYAALVGASNATFGTLPKAQAYAIATVLFAPVVVWLLHHNTAAIAITGEDGIFGDLEGSFIIPPGGFFCVAAQGAAAAAAAHSSSLMWEEVPIS